MNEFWENYTGLGDDWPYYLNKLPEHVKLDIELHKITEDNDMALRTYHELVEAMEKFDNYSWSDSYDFPDMKPVFQILLKYSSDGSLYYDLESELMRISAYRREIEKKHTGRTSPFHITRIHETEIIIKHYIDWEDNCKICN